MSFPSGAPRRRSTPDERPPARPSSPARAGATSGFRALLPGLGDRERVAPAIRGIFRSVE
jgi:hypothetical protein